MVDCDEGRDDEAHGAPDEGRDSLHAEDEGVGDEVAGVGEGVFFPELAEEVLGGTHVLVVDGEVSYSFRSANAGRSMAHVV